MLILASLLALDSWYRVCPQTPDILKYLTIIPSD